MSARHVASLSFLLVPTLCVGTYRYVAGAEPEKPLPGDAAIERYLQKETELSVSASWMGRRRAPNGRRANRVCAASISTCSVCGRAYRALAALADHAAAQLREGK
jgi:hypothetical protein